MLCQDGELAECINMEVRNEELVPIEKPVQLPFTLETGEKLLLVHNMSSGDKNYIIHSRGYLKAFRINEGAKEVLDFSLHIENIDSIQYIGNTVVAYSSEGPHYILYSHGDYKYLGSKIPEVGISFDLSGDFVLSDEFDLVLPDMEFTDSYYQSDVSSQLLAEVNKFVESKSVAAGKFMFPFFVRYAIRLYDGTTYTMQSAPILMLPSTNIAPFASSYTDMSAPKATTDKAQIGAFIASLEATISNLDSNFEDWKDIISGVDIFVSKQIYTYDQNGTKFGNAALSGSKFVGKYNGVSTVWDGYSQMYNNTTLTAEGGKNFTRWYIPSREFDEIRNDITGTSLFYKYASLDTDDIYLGNAVSLEGKLEAVETQMTIPDDYMTHDVLIPKSTFVYNKRLNISNVERKLFSGFPLQNMTHMVKEPTNDGFGYNLSFGRYKVYTYIKSSGEDIVVESEASEYGALFGSYLFYPDTDAYKMILVDDSNGKYAEVSLTEHPMLNGAYAFIGFNSLPFVSGTPSIMKTSEIERLPNKIFTSEVNNPFYFPLEGINTVGSDEIIGMAAVTVPISQGQFGQYPLLVFCSDGNFALKVDEQGYYSGISPVQEDTVLGSDKITPLENSIVIITKKGIMMTSGGEMAQIATHMDGANFETSSLNDIGASMDEYVSLVEHASDGDGFLSYLYGSRMAYDYSSNRLVIYNPDKKYSYIYSFENGTVTKLSLSGERIVTSVMDYPDTIIQTESGKLYSLYEKEEMNSLESHRYGLAVTRPMKLDNAAAYKIIHRIKNLGRFGEGSSVKYRLYGSMDGTSYSMVRSLRGRSYLYYRMVFYTHMLPKEGFSGTLMAFDYRMSHKFR